MTLFKRLISLYIDYMIAYVSMIIIFIIINTFVGFDISKHIYWGIVFATVWCSLKDISGRSVGKHIFKLKLIDRNTDKTPALWKRILRNVGLFIWPAEILTMFIRKDHRRLLDVAFNTDVIPKTEALSLHGQVEKAGAEHSSENSEEIIDDSVDKSSHVPNRKKLKVLIAFNIIGIVTSVLPFLSMGAIIIGAISRKELKKYSDKQIEANKMKGIFTFLNVISLVSLIEGILYSALYTFMISIAILS